MSFKFPKTLRMRTRRDYKRMGWQAHRQEGLYICVDEKKNNLLVTRLGITVTRRYGDAHLRNRFKRLVREAFRLSYAELRKGFDFNVRPQKQALDATFQDIQNELKRFML